VAQSENEAARPGSPDRGLGGLIPQSTGLVWGIKRSLLGYLRRLPDGVVSIDDGVGLTSDYDFHFPFRDATGLSAPGPRVLRFGGYIHLFGHLGAMSVALANPWLHLQEDMAQLSFEIDDEAIPERRGVLFTVALTQPSSIEGDLRWDGLVPCLTPVGADLFQSNYPVGTEFDPMDVCVPLAT
jgi:hypothetical protein